MYELGGLSVTINHVKSCFFIYYLSLFALFNCYFTISGDKLMPTDFQIKLNILDL